MSAKQLKGQNAGLKSGDIVMRSGDAKDTDIVIIVVGQTGAGKSFFINTLLSQKLMEERDGFKSCTVHLQPAFIENPPRPELKGKRIVIIDTPGSNDHNYTQGEDILHRIKAWMAVSDHAKMTLGGVIYLHDISEARMQKIAKQDVENYLQEAKEWGTTFILGTTKWGEVGPGVGKVREKALTDELRWCTEVHRFQVNGSSHSAWGLVDAILHGVKEGQTKTLGSISQNELTRKNGQNPKPTKGPSQVDGLFAQISRFFKPWLRW